MRMAGTQAMEVPPCSGLRTTGADTGVFGDQAAAPKFLGDDNISNFRSSVHCGEVTLVDLVKILFGAGLAEFVQD